MEKYYPGLNKVLVEQQQIPTDDSILTLSSNVMSYGKVIALGPIKDKKEIGENFLKEGDNVYFLTQAGINMQLPEGTYKLMNVTDILLGVNNKI